MEPMADSSVSVKEGIDRGKFRLGLRRQTGGTPKKRKRADESGHGDDEVAHGSTAPADQDKEAEMPAKKKRIRGPKGPNPLSVKKPRKRGDISQQKPTAQKEDAAQLSTNREQEPEEPITVMIERPSDLKQNVVAKKKRRRKHKPPLLSTLREKSPDSAIDN